MAERDDEQVLLDQLESSPEPNATPTVAPAEPVPVSNGHGDRDEFQQLFDQWDAEQQNPAEQPPAAEPAQEVLSPDNLDELLARFDREQAELEHQRLREAADPMLQQENAALLERMEAARQAYQREVDLAEFDRIGTELGKDLREEFPYLPESFVTAKLYQLAMTEQVLVQAFDNRRQNPRYFQHCMHLVRQALRKEAASIPDPQLSADRELVAQAVRAGSRGKHFVEDPPPRYGELSNADMRNEIRRLGFDPGF